MKRPERVLARHAARKLAGFVLVALLAGCGKEVIQAVAIEPRADTVCELDGMVLRDHPGPKAQIHFAEGKPWFFCDLKELFAILLAPEEKRVVAAMWVQDMARADWMRPEGHWIDARTAFYVTGSGKHGSMGPTFASFANEADAQAFAQKEGGEIHRFDQITLAMVDAPPHGHDSNLH